MATEGAVLGRCWLFLDRWVSRNRSAEESSAESVTTARLKAHAEAAVTDEQLKNAGQRYPSDTPETKEAYYIRENFESRSLTHLVCPRLT